MLAVTRIAGLKFKEGVSDAQKRTATDDLLKVYADLSHLVNVAPIGGKNISDRGLDKGLDLMFTVEFKSMESRDEFYAHPLHESYGTQNGDLFADVFVYELVKDEYGF